MQIQSTQMLRYFFLCDNARSLQHYVQIATRFIETENANVPDEFYSIYKDAEAGNVVYRSLFVILVSLNATNGFYNWVCEHSHGEIDTVVMFLRQLESHFTIFITKKALSATHLMGVCSQTPDDVAYPDVDTFVHAMAQLFLIQ